MPFRMMQVGLGDFGRKWLAIVNNHRDWTYAALATRKPEVLRECGREVGLGDDALFSSIADAVNQGIEADAALVTTPSFRHRHDVEILLQHGLHVLVEKPLAGTWDDSIAIREAAQNADGMLMIGENYRFGDGARAARKIVSSGEIGQPEFLGIDYFVNHTFPDGDWRNDYDYPLLVENATHQFDLVRYVTGSNPQTVFCTALKSARTPHWPFPTVCAQFEMTGGLHFQFNASWSYPELATPWEGVWRLHGSKGAILWSRNRLEVHGASGVRSVDVPSQPTDYTLGRTFAEFHASLEEARRPVTDIQDNLQTVAMVFAAIRSHESSQPVSVVDMLAESSRAAAQ